MLFSERKLEISSKEYWTYSESYFPNCFVSPWGPTQLCQIVSNHEYVSVYSKYLNLGGILTHFISISSHQSRYVCVVRVIQCRYILIQNTFITEASYGKFFFISALLPSIFTMLTLQRYSERHYVRICYKTHSLYFVNFGFLNQLDNLCLSWQSPDVWSCFFEILSNLILRPLCHHRFGWKERRKG